VYAGLGGLYGVVLVVDGGGWAGEIVNLINLDIEREGHVMALHFEARIIHQMTDIFFAAGEKIIDADHLASFFQQFFA